MNNLTQKFHDLGSDASVAALKTISNMLRQQALVMAFADIFMLLTFLFAAFIFALPLVRKPAAIPTGDAGAH